MKIHPYLFRLKQSRQPALPLLDTSCREPWSSEKLERLLTDIELTQVAHLTE